MKLKKLKSIGHNAADSYLSTLGHIGNKYTATVLYRKMLSNSWEVWELNVLEKNTNPPLESSGIIESLSYLNDQFNGLLSKENIPTEAVSEYKLELRAIGNRVDVIHLFCSPIVIDMNGKIHKCATVSVMYPEPV